MNEPYTFRFQIQKVIESNDEFQSRDVYVVFKIRNEKKDLLHEGLIRVKFNQIGIYPFPIDISKQISSKNLQRLLIMELKRYIKPQRRYLSPGTYKPIW